MMEFGFNCINFLPTMKKCRVLIKKYMQRTDLTEYKWVDTNHALIHMSILEKDLVDSVKTNEIKFKQQKDGTFLFQITAAWQYDGCPLANAGGQCMYFEAHNGPTISCTRELMNMTEKHPNETLTATGEEIDILRKRLLEANIEINKDT